ncbi:M23 family metallopeptidase [Acetivibrio clariflavus]|uniref:M23 family metallopeptidase n=1 Tax=Acetivibrio clariflavus TaxID=288965 RepID=UPI0004826069|nr:M23 family metallopeptidase [Acetivibrio clariflavus]
MRKRSKVKRDKYLSIMFVPHSTNEIKTFKISSWRSKLYIFTAIVLALVIGFTSYLGNIIHTNNKLKIALDEANSKNEEQARLLAENAEQIAALLEKERQYAENISEFSEKYKQMTENYLDSNMESLTASRGSNSRSFIDDASELREILEKLRKINNSDDSIANKLSESEKKLQSYIETFPTLWPADGPISSSFGYRTDPIYSSERKHEGIDIAASYGADIRASATGKVIFSGTNGNYGKCIIINHNNGITTLYGHASSLLVKEGQTVKKGDVIAKVGSTGKSTGPHLHFEVRINGTPDDPLKYLDKK